MLKFAELLGSLFLDMLHSIGRISEFIYKAFLACITPPYEFRLLSEQIVDIGFKSIPIVIVAAFAIGMVMIVQLSWGFAWFGATGLVGPVVTLAFVRELGPVVTSLLVGGRVGAGITAEIGSMKVTEQIDALRTLGADPLKKLVAPRIIAALISFPLLTVIADLFGILGAMLMSMIDLAIEPRLFLASMRGWVDVSDFISGISKTFFFGIIVTVTGCYVGFNAEGGTRGVGRATTYTVVVALLLIVVSDFLLSKIFQVLFYI